MLSLKIQGSCYCPTSAYQKHSPHFTGVNVRKHHTSDRVTNNLVFYCSGIWKFLNDKSFQVKGLPTSKK